jgi:2'-5' RNA ligase
MDAFAVGVGPLNAFPNALFAEVQDETGCLRALRTGLRRALPRRARPPLRWPFVPHVTLGYWGRQPATSLIAALTPFRQVEPVPLRVERVRLTIYALNDGPSRVDLLRTAREEIIAEFALKP